MSLDSPESLVVSADQQQVYDLAHRVRAMDLRQALLGLATLIATTLIGAFAGMVIFWIIDDGPIYKEDESKAAIVNHGPIRPGALVETYRALTLYKDCVVRRTYWLVNQTEGWSYSVLDTGVAQKVNAGQPYESHISFFIPRDFPPGRYAAETIATCVRNPLTEVQQRLKSLEFTVEP